MATQILSYQEIIEKARETWPGKTGDERAERVKMILDTRLENYNNVTGFSKDEILTAFEKIRDVNTVNFYQPNRFPLLEDVYVFDTIEDFKKEFSSGKYICPSCGKESTDPYECMQENCKWTVWGLLGDLGKGIRVIIKDTFIEHPVPMKIFKPVELAKSN